MNDLSRPPLKDPTAPIERGSVWRRIDESPWPTKNAEVKIIDARDGWVRYAMGNLFTDERMEEHIFRRLYGPTYAYATGDLAKVPVPRDELEGALADMLLRFHYREGSYVERDAAVRRAAAALGQQVQL